ncbi:hypothetical protein [Polyangium aurulentum]|uniref:hypothetical protein n=1 Tax=Polyangium aurulentum TaxID=2567896 RepID=UPI0010ADF62E|nr:hypothetical protein [Polyangium aurulentum]UQA56776.1 hypothetical protein E8A73_036565 [Polyangium aurulentum]
MKVTKAMPIEVVDAIEPVLALWEKRLGYALVMRVPETGPMGFAILENNGHTVGFQTRESMLEDVPAMAPHIQGPCVFQYMHVESLAAVLESLEGYTLLAGPRETWYGAKEVFLQDPAGYIAAFSEHKH